MGVKRVVKKNKRRKKVLIAILLMALFGSSMEASKTYFTREYLLKNKNKIATVIKNSEKPLDLNSEVLATNKEVARERKSKAMADYKIKEEKLKEAAKQAMAESNAKKELSLSCAMWYPRAQGKTVYLTFDDGPSSSVTPLVLEVLKRYNVKGTFFVLGSLCEENPQLIKRAVSEGNIVYAHSYSHIYNEVYKSPQSYKNEMMRTISILKSILGQNYFSKVIRMPGGSSGRNVSFKEATIEMGCQYVDWNCLSRDSEGKNLSVEEEVQNVKETSKGKEKVIVLMHDAGARVNTPKSLPQVIEYFISQGYSFEVIN